MEAGQISTCAGWVAALAAGLLAAGCGMPGAPLPPSLNLPQPVKDLHAVRTGGEVALTWSMPRRNTDQLLMKETLRVKVCRAQRKNAACEPAAQLNLAPGTAAAFIDVLPPAATTAAARELGYFVEVENAKGRAAGPSNVAYVVAGEAPQPVTGLAAEVRKGGVALRWTAIPGDATPVRLERRLLTPQPVKKKTDPLAQTEEPTEQNLLVTARAAEARALDRTTRFGESYEFRAQRVARVNVNGETVELTGKWSEPVRVEVKDIFPPDPPQGLAAVASSPETGAAIDLNWQPNTESDLAGYVVYRSEDGTDWQRASGSKPLAAPAFHDTGVVAGHSYHYAVTALDQGSRESQRSAEAEETVPAE